MMNREENLDFCIHYLQRQEGESLQGPTTLEAKQRMLRALMNVWPPQPLDAEYLSAQDAELQAQREDKGVVVADELFAEGDIVVWQGDITRLGVDAIVNAANSGMLGCWSPLHDCIDNVIHSSAGLQLRSECDGKIKAGLWRGESSAEAGEAIITSGYNLPARYVLHTVGPIVHSGIPTPQQEAQLAQCYKSCLSLAEAGGCRSIAFCCISTGVFNFPHRRAAEIAVATIRQYKPEGMKIVFNVFKNIDHDIYQSLLRAD